MANFYHKTTFAQASLLFCKFVALMQKMLLNNLHSNPFPTQFFNGIGITKWAIFIIQACGINTQTRQRQCV